MTIAHHSASHASKARHGPTDLFRGVARLLPGVLLSASVGAAAYGL